MGLIINIIIAVVLVLGASYAYIHVNPQGARALILGGIQSILPDNVKIPTKVMDLLKHNPDEIKDFIIQKPFNYQNPSITSSDVKLLGKPKKIVEYYCSTDAQCSYFSNTAKCEQSSGICYEG